MTKSIQKYNEVSARAPRLVTGLKTALLLAPFGYSMGSAQDASITAMTADAQSGVDAVKTGVVALVGVILVIGLVIWGARHLKPRG